MREVYRGNGFIVTTNDAGEIFVALEEWPLEALRVSNLSRGIMVSYSNTQLEMIPSGHKTLRFQI